MKTKLVLWGSNDQDEKLLIAMSLDADLAEVTVFTFPADIVTEAFYNQMMNVWRFNQPVEFPEGYSKIIKELSISGKLLPQGVNVDKEDLISRAQTEWQFVVLSKKLKKSFDNELDDLKERISQLSQFDGSLWEELKGFWSKVQNQAQEKNLFREHAENLKKKTNDLFGEMKQLRRKLDSEFKQRSSASAEKFSSMLENVEHKIEEGLSLKPLFEELKSIQRDFKQTKFTREDRAKLWKRIDGAFKKVKKQRFGDSDKDRNNPVNRIQRRYDGLLKAIGKMEKSINRDEQDLEFEQNRINSTDGQLESQIRQAKVKMIEERIRSKKDKLEDMQKTKLELEAKLEVEKKKQMAREEKAAKEASAAAPEKSHVADSQPDTSDETSEDRLEPVDLSGASEPEQTPGSTTDETPTQDPPEQSIVANFVEVSSVAEDKMPDVESTMKSDVSEETTEDESASGPVESEAENTEENQDEQAYSSEIPSESDESILEAAGTAISESLEDVSDTISAVASVFGDKIKDKIKDFTGSSEEE